MSMQSVWSIIYKSLVTGALEKGGTWGGPECKASIPYDTHMFESAMWLAVCFLVFAVFRPDQKMMLMNNRVRADLARTSVGSTQRVFEILLGSINIGMYLQLVYYKFNMLSLVNLIQPCHVIMLLQGIALWSDGVLGVDIILLLLPALTGTLLAMIFPDTTGLDQPFEVESYWIQHWLIQLMPFYLLARRNYLALTHAGSTTTVCGLLILLFLHFSLFEVVDMVTEVNVEFMLCPSAAMAGVFGLVPASILQPSYRTPLTVIVFIVGTIISYSYIGLSNILRNVLKAQKQEKKVV
eukprot:gene25081-30295_t